MKLFQKLLFAPAILGLIAPISASASEITMSDFDAADEAVIANSSVDSLETKLNNFEVGTFSETTTMSGAASFQVGSVDGSGINEAVTATYSYDIDLNTSFTGDDNLYVGIETGNYSATSVDFALDSSGDGGDL